MSDDAVDGLAKVALKALAAALLIVMALGLAAALAQTDPRVTASEPARTASGAIARSRAVLRQFKHIYPCPATGKSTGPCPGWQLDHVVPLKCGGADAIGNLQWLPVEIKAASGAVAKDRWERKVYCQHKALK